MLKFKLISVTCQGKFKVFFFFIYLYWNAVNRKCSSHGEELNGCLTPPVDEKEKSWWDTRDLVNWKWMDFKWSSVLVSPRILLCFDIKQKKYVFVEISERSSVETRSALMWHSFKLLSWAIFHSWLYVYFKVLLPDFKIRITHTLTHIH